MIALRGFALALTLLACLPLFMVCHLFTAHNPVPRHFFAAVRRIMGLRIAIVGERRKKGAFLLCNHVSWLDIPALGACTGTCFVAHDGLARHGLLRWICRLNDTVFIARHDRRSVALQVEQVREAIRETGSLAIFPEGTTDSGWDIKPFKSSLLSALCPVPEGISVQPVWLDYGKYRQQIAWGDDEPGMDNFFRIAARRSAIGLRIHFLAPLEGDQLADRKTIAAEAHRSISAYQRETENARDQRVAL